MNNFIIVTIKENTLRVTILDSNCMRHILLYKDNFTYFKQIVLKSLTVANQNTFYTTKEGNITLCVLNKHYESSLSLQNVLYSPDINFTLIFVRVLDCKEYNIMFYNKKAVIKSI